MPATSDMTDQPNHIERRRYGYAPTSSPQRPQRPNRSAPRVIRSEPEVC